MSFYVGFNAFRPMILNACTKTGRMEMAGKSLLMRRFFPHLQAHDSTPRERGKLIDAIIKPITNTHLAKLLTEKFKMISPEKQIHLFDEYMRFVDNSNQIFFRDSTLNEQDINDLKTGYSNLMSSILTEAGVAKKDMSKILSDWDKTKLKRLYETYPEFAEIETLNEKIALNEQLIKAIRQHKHKKEGAPIDIETDEIQKLEKEILKNKEKLKSTIKKFVDESRKPIEKDVNFLKNTVFPAYSLNYDEYKKAQEIPNFINSTEGKLMIGFSGLIVLGVVKHYIDLQKEELESEIKREHDLATIEMDFTKAQIHFDEYQVLAQQIVNQLEYKKAEYTNEEIEGIRGEIREFDDVMRKIKTLELEGKKQNLSYLKSSNKDSLEMKVKYIETTNELNELLISQIIELQSVSDKITVKLTGKKIDEIIKELKSAIKKDKKHDIDIEILEKKIQRMMEKSSFDEEDVQAMNELKLEAIQFLGEMYQAGYFKKDEGKKRSLFSLVAGIFGSS